MQRTWHGICKFLFRILFIRGENLGLIIGRQSTEAIWTNVQIVNAMVDNRFHFSYKGIPAEAPLYIYPATEQLTLDGRPERIPNIRPEISKKVADEIGLRFTIAN